MRHRSVGAQAINHPLAFAPYFGAYFGQVSAVRIPKAPERVRSTYDFRDPWVSVEESSCSSVFQLAMVRNFTRLLM